MNKEPKYLLVVGGPTASGKTSLAIQLAQHFSTVILSADSRQFYQEMTIGNARPSEEELAAVPHYFIADRSVTKAVSAGTFAREAMSVLKELFQNKDHVVLVGGSGLFVKALTEGLDEFPEISPEARAKADGLFHTEGLVGLQKAIESADPVYYKEVDQQNPARLRRALEVFYETGKTFSSFRGAKRGTRFFTPIYLQPDWPRVGLYDRINQRVEWMFEAGLEEEVRRLEHYQTLPALQTVGYKEWWAYFAGEQTREQTLALIQQNTRRYAKRQLTWNRRDGNWKRIPRAGLRSALTYIQLVKQENLHLGTFPAEEVPVIIHGKESRQRLALVHGEEEIAVVADIAQWKNLAIIRYWFQEDLTYTAKAILLHEACLRAEAEDVFTFTRKSHGAETELLISLGWKACSYWDKLTDGLQKNKADDQLWKWQRDEQVF